MTSSLKRGPKVRDPGVLFWDKVSIWETCWEWTGSLKENGYGSFKSGSKAWNAHRFAYTFAYGEIPDGSLVCHRCDNPSCVRPAHLFLGTARENTMDMVSKGRWAKPPRLTGESHAGAKLSSAQVAKIRELSSSVSGVELAKMFGVTPASVSRYIRGASRVNG